MPSSKPDKTFGEYFTTVMRDRGFRSDEQLARRAMQVQEQLTPRMNIQRRTINNWRNDKSTPRNTEDQQFKLVALALKLTDDEIAHISGFIETEPTLQEVSKQPSFSAINFDKGKWGVTAAIGLTAIIVTSYFWINDKATITYLDQIPPTQLRVSDNGFMIDNSDTQVISERQLEELSGWELYVARNEIFARKGRPFVKVSSMCLQSHFDSWAKSDENSNGWYSKKSGDVRLTDLEYRNAEIIRNYECKIRGGQYSCSGQLSRCH